MSLTNAARVLLGDDERFWPRVQYTWRSTAGAEPVFARPVEAPLVRAMSTTPDLVEARLETISVNLSGGVQRQVADVPIRAVREALANALLHRDCLMPGAIAVEHSPESLRNPSPGRFPSGVRPYRRFHAPLIRYSV